MLYYPKSQIITNLYANPGELVEATSYKPYTGYYWATSAGQFFSGKTPTDTPIVRLIKNSDIKILKTPVVDSNNIFSVVVDSNETYNSLKNIKLGELNNYKLIPSSFQPTPTEQDYQTGEFRRYFVKKTNDIIYTEVNKNTYDNILNKNSQWLWQDYLAFNLPWSISGNKLQVAKTNNNIVDLTMKNLSLTKFNLYLRDDYTKFYK